MDFKPTERAADPFATHMPVLVGLARVLDVRRVLECGCGVYSTLTFLDRAAFPGLVRLRSLENDAAWLADVAARVGSDPRAELVAVSGPMWQAARAAEMGGYDLVFLDDSAAVRERAETIREVAAKGLESPVVVIHDYEQEDYRRAAAPFRNRFAFDGFNPQTGVVWNGSRVDEGELRALGEFIGRHAGSLSPSDLRGWCRAFDAR